MTTPEEQLLAYQQEQSNKQQQAAMFPYMQNNMQEHMGNMQEMTDPEQILQRFEYGLLGKVQNTEGAFVKKYVQKINERGAQEIVSHLRSIVNRNTFMSNLDDDMVVNLMRNMGKTVIMMMLEKKEEYAIVSDADRTAILHGCGNLALASLRRGWRGDDKRFWGRVTQEFVQTNPGQTQNQGGAMSKLNPMNWWRG